MQANVFIEVFSKLEDPRIERTRKHLFLDIIGLSIFAVMAGASCYTEIEDFCELHEDWLKQYFELPNGIPSHDTFSRVFSRINPAAFQEHFWDWLRSVIEIFPEGVIAIDGKSIRASRRPKKGLRALHIVSAWSCANGISLGQIKVEDKSNEITAIPDILKQLCIEGAIITIDAMGCQKQIADCINEQKGDYILRVKGNQGTLEEAMESTFKAVEERAYDDILYSTATDEMNNDHGRIESRRCIVLPVMYLTSLQLKWGGIKSLVMLISEREDSHGKTVENRYYISSLSFKESEKILKAIRSHWQIENNRNSPGTS